MNFSSFAKALVSAPVRSHKARSVYEKKLLRFLDEMTESPKTEEKPVEKPVESLNPVVILKANLQQPSENAPAVEAPKFVKPSAPIAKPQQQQPGPEIVYAEKQSRRNVVKTSSEEMIYEITQDKRGLSCLLFYVSNEL